MFDLKLFSVIASIVLVFALGYFAKKVKILKKEDAALLNNVIIYLTLPVFIFRAVYKASLAGGLYLIPLIALITIGITLLIAYFLGRVFKVDSQLIGTFMLAAAVGNTGYIAYPLLLNVFGNKGLVRGIFYDMFGSVIFILTVGLLVCAHFGRSEKKVSVIRQFFAFPPLYGLILGFALRPFTLPLVIMQALDIIAAVTVGLILISIGLALEPARGARRYLPLIALTFFLKLIFSPFIAFWLAKAFQLPSLSVSTTIISASMPTAMLTLIFGLKYELNVDFLSSAIFILTIASVVTIPVVQLVLSG